MSAYGAIVRSAPDSSGPLSATCWETRGAHVTVHHLTVETARSLPGLVEYLGAVMAKEIQDGMTYPQETMALDAFESYFFSGDVFLAISHSDRSGTPEGSETQLTIGEARYERTWEECVAGYYYVKPNYPGRSSHVSDSDLPCLMLDLPS
jgi:hypothetical protein